MSETQLHPALSPTAIELRIIETYEVFRKGQSLGNFHISERWKGLVELKNEAGEVILADAPNPIESGFFFGSQLVKSQTVGVVRASPNLISKLQAADVESQEKP